MMQNVQFNSIVEFFDYLPENERIITNLLREIILDTLPESKEKLTYQVPFYKLNKNISFIWPASILWGKTKKYTGVRMGFNYGNQLVKETDFLVLGERKFVAYKDFNILDEVLENHELIQSLLLKSKELDAKK